ncbi:metallophosphoesterase family protein [Bacillus aquiflavi]|nr:DNA repair exonuclease [Bacillus aquiflavi]
MKKTTFIHTADLHLDSPMIGLSGLPNHIFKRVRESTFKAFKAVTDEAIRRHVDFIIFAGDLFDGEDRSIRAQAHFRNEMERLGQHGIQAFVIHGNHDHLNGSWHHLSMPGNVHVFTHHVEYKAFQNESGAVVYLYGFSYPERHIYDDMTPYYQKALGADFHIGILHGHNEGGSEHSRYAPFKVNNLLHKEFHYWALGHIHKRTILHDEPYIVYPGNIQGRNRSELGMKGCYAVT